MAYGMIAWYVPLERFPDTYNGQPLGLVGLASQKNYISALPQQRLRRSRDRALVQGAIRGLGQDLNMGKSCLRFRHIEDVAARRHRRDNCPRRRRRLHGPLPRGPRLVAPDAIQARELTSPIPHSVGRVRSSTDASAARSCAGSAVKLADWLDEYRNFDRAVVTRTVADADRRLAGPTSSPPADRCTTPNPRWRERAERDGYGRAKTI